MAANIKSHFETQAQDNQAHLQGLMNRLEKLKSAIKDKTKSVAIAKPKKGKSAKDSEAKGGKVGKKSVDEKSEQDLDVTEDMLNMFVRLEVQRRYFNIVAIEMLSKQFGMKEPSSINALMKRQTKIPLSNLVSIGRNLTLEQYF
jgi:hypothetical protein